MKKNILILFFAAFLTLSLTAAEIYVSKGTGKNGNARTKTEPLKNLQKALDKARAGDKIYVAEGNYCGMRDVGFLEMKEPVEIYGGYSKDFSTRNVLKYRSTVIPPNAATPTSSSKPLLGILLDGKKGTAIIDGIIFDKGESNAYHPRDGKPKGVDTGYLTLPPQEGDKPNKTSSNQILYGIVGDKLVVQNCVFNNSAWYAIQLGIAPGGAVKVLNNVFTSSALAATEIYGRGRGNDSTLEVAYNTILFNWTRTKSYEDMGYGVRCMTKCNTNIHHNIIGCSYLGGIDRTRIDSSATAEKMREIKVDHNRFFLNKQGDMTLPSGGGKFERVKAADFEDLDLASATDNEELQNVQGLKNAINKAYLEGFISLAFSEKTDYDLDSSVNQFRSAMGMNTVGKISTKVSMFANRYPLEDSIKLFGAVSGFGAQSIK